MKISKSIRNTISPYLFMQFMEPLSNADASVDAGWDYLNDCWQPKLVEITKELAPSMIRYGGCFASYYHWKEAVGPKKDRTPILNQCWDGIFSNYVGTSEVADFCKQVNAEPLMVVNSESDGRMYWAYPADGIDRFGTADEAAEWVAYCNDPDNALRLSHGIKEPLNIKWWQIGNETSYDKRGYNLEQAIDMTKRFADAMLAVDPDLKLIVWGDDGWAPAMCEAVGDKIELVAFHHHFDSGLEDSVLNDRDYRRDPDLTWKHFMNACHSLKEKIDKVRAEVKPYGKKLAMTEGHFAIDGKYRCTALSSWASGVSYARMLMIQEHASDVLEISTLADFCGNNWQNNAVMIPTPVTRCDAYLQPVGQVMKLFRHHIGKYYLPVETDDHVDACASISEDGKTVYLHLANTCNHCPAVIKPELDDMEIASMTAYEIAADPTEEIGPMNVHVFDDNKIDVEGDSYTLPAAAVAVLEITIK